jgi:hypothetical protein
MTFRLYLVRETDLARLYSRTPKETPGKVFWIPRSVTPRIIKFAEVPGRLREVEIEVEDWWAEERCQWATAAAAADDG